MEIPQRGGLPHSDIHGSTPARGSPWLFAACHVFHRLLVPRHPPNALIALEINVLQIAPQNNPPCAGTIHSQKNGNKSSLPIAGISFTQHIVIIAFERRRHPLLEHSLSEMVGQTSQLAYRAITTQKARFLPQNRCLHTRQAEPETARPKTYQNLIHNLKNNRSQSKARKHSQNSPPDVTQAKPLRNLFSSRECLPIAKFDPAKNDPASNAPAANPAAQAQQWWRRAGSNR